MKTFKNSLPILICLLTMNISPTFANDDISTTVLGNGIGIGSALAIAICWTRTESVFTAMLAGVFGWLYVIYFLIIREQEK